MSQKPSKFSFFTLVLMPILVIAAVLAGCASGNGKQHFGEGGPTNLDGHIMQWDQGTGQFDSGVTGDLSVQPDTQQTTDTGTPSDLPPVGDTTAGPDLPTPVDSAPPADTTPVVDSVPTPDTGACGAITYEGCCDGEILYFCENGQVEAYDCTPGPLCGWDATKDIYNCGTNGDPDPSGTHPMDCP